MADSSHVDSNITTTATDGAGNIIVSVSQSNITESNSVESSITTGGRGEKGDTGDTGPAGVVQSIVAGNNIDIDNTDPTNPVVSVETLTLSDVSDVTASATELNYTDGVTSAIQTQIDGKSSTAHTHVLAAGATDVTSSAAELNILDGATLSTTELNYVDGVTSAIQTQLDGKVDENSSITGATKTKITYDAKGLVTAGADATTADIADSTNKRYVTDAQLTVIGNTSGTNTGDQDLSGYVPTSRTVNGHALTADVTVTKSDVGLGNVDNTSDATKNAATATLTNKTLTNPLVNTIYDTNGNKSLQLNATASAVNYLYVVNGATGNSISFRANGTDTNIPIGMFSKGSGQVQLRSDTNGFILAGDSVASGVNYVGLTNAATGTGPTITSTGTDTDVHLNLTAKGAGNIQVPTGTGIALYNTSDKTTNYEKVTQGWSGNIYAISTLIGGTGTARYLRLGTSATAGSASPTRFLDLVPSGSNTFSFTSPSSLAGNIMTMTGIDLQGASVSQTAVAINPQIHQSGTSSYTALLVNPTETTTGSGAKLLADFQVGGTSKTKIDTFGNHIISSGSGAGFVAFNTADEVTNYERVRMYWSSNVFRIATELGGTGNTRDLQILSGGRSLLVQGTSSANGAYQMTAGSTSSTSGEILKLSATFTAASGNNVGLDVAPVLNGSGTQGYTALLVNPTETATGSGTKLLADFQVGGTSKVSIKNDGVIFPVKAATASAPTYVKGGIYFDTTLNKLRVGGASGWETITSI